MKVVIISISSDIGIALAQKWISDGWEVFGTYRSESFDYLQIENLKKENLLHCDLLIDKSIDDACNRIVNITKKWDVLVFAPGDLEPIGNFIDVDFKKWENGINVNLIKQLKILHYLLPFRNFQTTLTEPSVLFFAGGGTNNAVPYFSSYTLSKIALIKMCELLDAEIPDTRFVIIGPGCVKTKIHEPTLKLGAKASGGHYYKTVERLKGNDCTPMEKVVECCDWIIKTPCKDVRGRNFGVASDEWNTSALTEELKNNSAMYKLRRCNNSWTSKTSP